MESTGNKAKLTKVEQSSNDSAFVDVDASSDGVSTDVSSSSRPTKGVPFSMKSVYRLYLGLGFYNWITIYNVYYRGVILQFKCAIL